MKIIYNKLIPFGGNKLFTFLNIIFAKFNAQLTTFDINHEAIHWEQEKETLILPFYIWYCIEFLIRLIQHRSCHKAYRNISFEKEAYDNQNNIAYIKTRNKFSWTKYLK